MLFFTLYNIAIDDLYDVSEALVKFEKANWRVLGRQLGLDGVLGGIKADYGQEHVEECFNQVLKEWLKRNHDEARCGPPT